MATNGMNGADWSRREALRLGLAGAAGVWMGGRAMANLPTNQPAKTAPKAKAKSVIQVWLWGGPTQNDTFDPKPDAGSDYTGPFTSPIETNVSGIRINELMPLLAKQAHRYSLIRTMTHGNNGHETAAYLVQTGRPPGGKLVFPSAGAIVALFNAYEAGYKGLIPPYIVLTRPQGRFSEAGFLGPKYKPFATGGNPAAAQFVVEGIVAEGVTRERQEARRDLLGNLNTLSNSMKDDPTLALSKDCAERAYDLILGDEGKVFDLNQEKDEVRLAYGRNTFGQSCLLARRLVEKGFPYITINYGGWDTHKGNFQAMRSKLPQLDSGLATLLEELAQRGLLESTIIWCCGEFGRTPKIDWQPPWDGGRHHYGACFSALVAGGGFKGGHVVGESDKRAEHPKDRPVYPYDLLASMYELLGIDPEGALPHPSGMRVPMKPSEADGVKTAGKLKEIM
ncbi:MAG: hypothetical protein BWX88_01023 [Planctomycetes bacterium ADurb.Bin126]|nr:MAG: hypothetical protein BWX88_01023 [Planctomycetes bacterium ADurb.Bin126]HQL74906.1 DUF1501 domain-containing protein [Phycisphaerae bacterium]